VGNGQGVARLASEDLSARSERAWNQLIPDACSGRTRPPTVRADPLSQAFDVELLHRREVLRPILAGPQPD
jgi:hypothetical protein